MEEQNRFGLFSERELEVLERALVLRLCEKIR